MAFDPAERHQLQLATGVGPIVVARLEEVGLDSLQRLRCLGVDQVIQRVCEHTGDKAWRNRRRALQRAMTAIESRAGAAAHSVTRADAAPLAPGRSFGAQ